MTMGSGKQKRTKGLATKASSSESPYKRLHYPLNVFATALWLEEGRVDYLHYGLFSDQNEELAVAQKRAAEMIISRLPKPPCRILEVGLGLGTIFRTLVNQGYTVTGISPDENEIAVVRQNIGESSRIIQTQFESLKAEPESFDVILFHESGRYIDTVDLFYKAFDFLADDGQVIILEELALKYDKQGSILIHLEGHIPSMAHRSGFLLEEREDVSSMAIPTLDYMYEVLETYHKPITESLDLSERQYLGLMESNRSYKQKFTRKEIGYVFLRFRKTKAPRWRVQNVGKENVTKVLELFKLVFDEDINLAFWEWKYGEGRGKSAMAVREGRAVAHYGGLTRRIMYFGKPRLACQIVDVMVSPAERGVLTKKGSFLRTAASFIENIGSHGTGARHYVGFGFPNKRHMEIADRLGFYTEVGRIVEVRWPTLITGWMSLTYARRLNPDKDDRVVDQLWSEMESDLKEALVGVRDWTYLEHRYLSHPNREYEAFMVQTRLLKRPIGVLVLQKHANGMCELMDVVTPLKHIPALVNQARRIAGENGMTSCYCWITEQNSSYFDSKECKVSPLDVYVPTSIWTEGPPVNELRNKWWLMSGDTDFR